MELLRYGHESVGLRFNSYSASKDQTNFLKTPAMSFPAGKTMTLTFWWKNPAGGDFSVYISTDGGEIKTPLKEGMTGQVNWKQESIALSDYVGASNVTIHFKGTSNYGDGDAYIYLDDVVIGELLPAGEWQTAATDKANCTLTGLLAEREYEARVQGNCGSDGTSEWSGIVTFTTDIACLAPTGLAWSNRKSDRVVLSWTNGGSEYWVVAYKAGDDDDFTEVNVATDDVTIEGTTVTYTLTGLAPETSYTVKVRDNCGARVRFIGTYDKATFTDEDKSILFMGEENALYYPDGTDGGVTIGTCRAYFKIGNDSGSDARLLTGFNLGFGEGKEQGIKSVTPAGAGPVPASEGSIYTLSGVKVSVTSVGGDLKSPTPAVLRKGLYIKNGKKTVVK